MKKGDIVCIKNNGAIGRIEKINKKCDYGLKFDVIIFTGEHEGRIITYTKKAIELLKEKDIKISKCCDCNK